MKIPINHIIILYLSGVLLGCASTAQGPQEREFAAGSRGSDCISQSSVRDYEVLDEANLIVTAAARRKYHVSLWRRASGLRSSWQIGFQSPTGQICPGFGNLVIDDGLGADVIRIDSIRRLSPEDEEDLLFRFGKKEPAGTQAPAAQEVDTAAVEELD